MNAAPDASVNDSIQADIPPCCLALSAVLLSTGREQLVGGLEQKRESRKPVEPSGDPPEKSEELRADI